MKQVKLEYDHAVTITDEAFEQIRTIVQNNLLCETCQRPYTDERPQVARNRCVSCFLQYHHSSYLRYVGILKTESATPVYGFLDAVGYIHPSTQHDDVHSLKQSNRHTLNYYGYPVPLKILLDGEQEERRLDSSSFCWQMYGEFKQGQSVLVIEYTQPWGDHLKILFLSYRNGEAILLDKKRGQGRKWFIEAKKQIEATKVDGVYHYKGRNSYQFFHSDMYELVAQFASAEYDQQRKE